MVDDSWVVEGLDVNASNHRGSTRVRHDRDRRPGRILFVRLSPLAAGGGGCDSVAFGAGAARQREALAALADVIVAPSRTGALVQRYPVVPVRSV